MPEEVNYKPEERLIVVRVWGDDPIEDWHASKEQVVRLHEMHGADMMLVDVREQETAPSLPDIFDFGDHWPQEIRAAILVGRTTPDDIMFLETVAMHRRKRMRIFYNEDEAMTWLRE